MDAIIIEEAYWANSYLSIARYYGGVSLKGKTYNIVNKYGITLFELSNPKSKYYVGDDNKAIERNEPADLVLVEWIPIYRELGRERTIQLVKKGVGIDEAKMIVKDKKKIINK